MATKSIGPVVRAVLLAASPVTTLVVARICKEGGVLQDEALPYVTYSVDSNKPNWDLAAIDDYSADVTLAATSLDYDECDTLARAISDAMSAASGTYAGVVVKSVTDPDVSDTPDGPIDLDGLEVFQSEITVSLTYA